MVSKHPILCLSDTHFPACDMSKIKQMFSLVSTMNFKYICHLGDLTDQFSQSRFPKNPNYMTPEQETVMSRALSEEMWYGFQKHFPKAKKFQLSGNHCSPRQIKNVLSKVPEVFHFMDLKSFMTFDNVETLHDYRDNLVIEKINFIHGFSSKLGFHADYFQDNVVCGHSHRAGLLPIRLKGKTIFEFNVGYLGDPAHPFLSYTPFKKINKWTPGFGIIDHLGARFIAL